MFGFAACLLWESQFHILLDLLPLCYGTVGCLAD